MLDGIPFNDPFGGWVYWTRVPLDSVDRIEMTDGTTSSLYGNYAMGGVINIITTRPTRSMIELKPQYGNVGSPKFDFLAGDRWNKVGALVEGSFFKTDGFPIVAPIERGPIDNNSNVDYRNVSGKVEYAPIGPRQRLLPRRLFQRGSEQRQGRRAQRHAMDDRQRRRPGAAAGWKRPPGPRLRRSIASPFQLPGRDQPRHDPQPRSSRHRSACADQRRRRDGARGRRPSNGSNMLSAGADWRWIDGDSQEGAYVAAVPQTIIPPVTIASVLSVQRVSGGTQQLSGAFRSGHLHAGLQAGDHAERARRSLAQLRRPQPGNHGLDRAADGQQPAVHSRASRHRRQPASRGVVSRHGSRERLGRGEFRIPRADAHRALPPVFGRRRSRRVPTISSDPSVWWAAKPGSTSRRRATSPPG